MAAPTAAPTAMAAPTALAAPTVMAAAKATTMVAPTVVAAEGAAPASCSRQASFLSGPNCPPRGRRRGRRSLRLMSRCPTRPRSNLSSEGWSASLAICTSRPAARAACHW
eukprot:4601213-Prymnesium_polylepis.1